jgi:hypothetical protein
MKQDGLYHYQCDISKAIKYNDVEDDVGSMIPKLAPSCLSFILACHMTSVSLAAWHKLR